jgi:1-phosphofructokinase family hexose kinase
MILCVTLNSCLDKTLTVPSWQPGDLVRGSEIREVVGGKGNNVARALRRLGRPSRPVTFLGGPTGQRCRDLLTHDDSLAPIVVNSESPTRVILTVLTEGTTRQTAFFDPDPTITDEEAAAMLDRVEQALAHDEVSALTLSGSSPSPATHGLYSDLISLALARRIPVFLDTYGPALDSIWGFWPTSIQVNRKEAAGRLRKEKITDEDVLSLLADWDRHRVSVGVVTDGPSPALFKIHGKNYRAIPPEIEAVNPIGSGDSLLAGLVESWLSGQEPEAMIRRAMACAAANASVWDAGAIDVELARELEQDVVVEAIE